MSIGNATLMVVERDRFGGMSADAYASWTELVVSVLDSGRIALDECHGSADHVRTLQLIQEQITTILESIAKENAKQQERKRHGKR